MKRVAVVTGSRAEYGQLRPFLRLARDSRVFDLQLVVAGLHMSSRHGRTVREIKADGFEISGHVPMLGRDDSPAETAKALGRGISEFAGLFGDLRPDLVLVEGDRVEPLAATLAAGYMGIPVAHGGGGDVSGTVDNAARHAISHFASLHFVANEEARQQLERMGVGGEIHVTGALGIDAIMQRVFPPRETVLESLGLPADSRYLLVTFHPESESPNASGPRMRNILRACLDTGLHMVATLPNSDPGSAAIIIEIESVRVRNQARVRSFPSLGSDGYLDALRYAEAVVGNSSSGLYEAPTLRVPVVNVGHRQDGRLRSFCVQDCGYSYEEIRAALDCDLGRVKEALGSFEAGALAMGVKLAPLNPYGDGHAAERMLAIIEGRLGG